MRAQRGGESRMETVRGREMDREREDPLCDVAVSEDLAGFRLRDDRFRHSRVRAADPEDLFDRAQTSELVPQRASGSVVKD